MPISVALDPLAVATRSRPSSSDCEWFDTSKAMAVAGAGRAVASKVAYPDRESPSGSIVHMVAGPSSAVPATYMMFATDCHANEVGTPGNGMGSSVLTLRSGAEWIAM